MDNKSSNKTFFIVCGILITAVIISIVCTYMRKSSSDSDLKKEETTTIEETTEKKIMNEETTQKNDSPESIDYVKAYGSIISTTYDTFGEDSSYYTLYDIDEDGVAVPGDYYSNDNPITMKTCSDTSLLSE